MKKIILGLILLSFSQVWAKVKTVKEDLTIEPLIEPVLLYPNQKAYEVKMKEAKGKKRDVAQAQTDVGASTIEEKFPKDFFVLRTKLIGDGKSEKGVENPEMLDRIIVEYSKEEFFKGLSPQTKFVALQLRALRPFKSFIFRAKNYIKANSATRTMIVSMLRAQIAGIQGFFPVKASNDQGDSDASVNHWSVVFDYITQNSADMRPPIETDAGLHAFMSQLTNSYTKILNDFVPLIEQGDIWWDNKLFMSFANIPDSRNRYAKLGQPELKAVYASFSLTLSSLYSTTAYSFDGLQHTMNSIGAVMGITSTDAAVRALVSPLGADGISSSSRHVILNSRKETLFKRTSDGKTRMQWAYHYLKESARASRESFELTKDLPMNAQNLFDPRLANAFPRIAGLSFETVDKLVSDSDGPVSAISQGDVIKVDLFKFYNEPPESLTELYPQDWDRGPASFDVQAWGKSDKLRNYRAGMATKWNLNPYQKLFPDLKPSKSNPKLTEDIPKFTRILAQTWGASIFAIPLGAVIF